MTPHADEFEDCRQLAEQHVLKYCRWFHRRAYWARYFFRTAGLTVITLSVSLPVLAAVSFAHRNFVIGAAGLAIALLTGIRSFFQWDRVWALVRSTEMALSFRVAQWELSLLALKELDDQREAHTKAIAITGELISAAQKIIADHSTAYFSGVSWPQRSEDHSAKDALPPA